MRDSILSRNRRVPENTRTDPSARFAGEAISFGETRWLAFGGSDSLDTSISILTENAIAVLPACSLVCLRCSRVRFLATAGVVTRLPERLRVGKLRQFFCPLDTGGPGGRCAGKLYGELTSGLPVKTSRGEDWIEVPNARDS